MTTWPHVYLQEVGAVHISILPGVTAFTSTVLVTGYDCLAYRGPVIQSPRLRRLIYNDAPQFLRLAEALYAVEQGAS